MLAPSVDFAALQPKLIGWLREKMPCAQDLSIGDVDRSGAGFTNVSIPFTLSWHEAGQQRSEGMLFRAAGTAHPVYPDAKLERQFRVMQCLRNTRVPVPKTFWMEADEGVLGFPFYLMARVDGVVPSEYPPYHSFGVCHDATPEDRARMWWGTLQAMTEIHKLDWQGLGLSFLGVPGPVTGPIDSELHYWTRFFDWVGEADQPVLTAALEWLGENRYAPPRVRLCWGDARLPNTMFDATGNVVAVLDWDMAILSDPESDLAFLIALDWLLSEGTGVPRLEGFPDRETTIRHYEELTGWRVENFFYNEVFATLRAALVILRVQKNLFQAGIELPGADPLRDNFCTRRLAELLDLPPPGAPGRNRTPSQEVRGTVELRISGPAGGDWHFVAEPGRLTLQAGRPSTADTTVTVEGKDWAAIQRGEINPFNAWTGGKLKVSGDHALYQQLADAIVKAWRK